MGSFNISCAVSHLSISSGDECVFIPLRPVRWRVDKHRLGGFICSNNGSCAIYRPATFPIYGKYNDYGQLIDVEENVTTRALKQYNLPYEPMIEVLNSQRDLYDTYSGTEHWMDKKIAKFQSSYAKTNLESAACAHLIKQFVRIVKQHRIVFVFKFRNGILRLLHGMNNMLNVAVVIA